MTSLRPASLRPRGATGGSRGAIAVIVAAVAVAACASGEQPPTTAAPAPPSAPASASPTPTATPEPTPSPSPSPRFTNEPDDKLTGLIPQAVAGVPVVLAPLDEFGLTPGDVGTAFGEIGNRFASLALAYVERPRLSLYAMRVDGDPVTTAELEPHLATAGRYVGIAGLDPEPWEAAVVGRNQVWVRPEDNATAAGTHVYTWSSGEFVFLLIGVDDAVNRALIEALPGEPAPTPRPAPSRSASASPAARPSPGG
jgi:hypothetical protein